MHILGLDVGGSGIKGAVIDTQMGRLITERHRIETPHPASPEAVVETVVKIVEHFSWSGLVGCGFPAVVKDGTVHTASNIAPEWVGVEGQQMLEGATGCSVWLVNDADAAGVAEMHFGAGRGQHGLVIIMTFGTGIGTSLFIDGRLVPNTELGHIEIRGKDAERRAADGVRKSKSLEWDEWAQRVDEYLLVMERLFWPDLFIVGGGVSKKSQKFFPLLTVQTPVVHAHLLNEAGMIGAAVAAELQLR